MLAATIGAVLLAALASSVGTFAETVDYLDESSVADTDAALARIASDVRYAWRVDVPTRSQLLITDSAGGVTRYYGSSGDLRVTLPTGEDGVLLSGITGLTFENETVRRLREGNTNTFNGILHRQLPDYSVPPESLVLQPGEELALSFRVDSDAGRSSVSGVTEQVVGFTPTAVQLQLASGGLGAAVTIDLQASRAPSDARPRSTASSLNNPQTVSGLRLPLALPRGISLFGDDDDELDDDDIVEVTDYVPPTVIVPFSITGVPAEFEPGVSYTVRVKSVGSDPIVLQSRADASQTSIQKHADGTWSRQPAIVAMQISGTYRTTSTTESQEISLVRAAIATDAGAERVSSTAVYSQALAEDPWLGVTASDSPPGS